MPAYDTMAEAPQMTSEQLFLESLQTKLAQQGGTQQGATGCRLLQASCHGSLARHRVHSAPWGADGWAPPARSTPSYPACQNSSRLPG